MQFFVVFSNQSVKANLNAIYDINVANVIRERRGEDLFLIGLERTQLYFDWLVHALRHGITEISCTNQNVLQSRHTNHFMPRETAE